MLCSNSSWTPPLLVVAPVVRSYSEGLLRLHSWSFPPVPVELQRAILKLLRNRKENAVKKVFVLALILAVFGFGSYPHTKNFSTSVVEKVALTSQTTLPTAITTLFTPSSGEDVDYRVSVYVANPSQASSSALGVTIYWTDELSGGNNGC